MKTFLLSKQKIFYFYFCNNRAHWLLSTLFFSHLTSRFRGFFMIHFFALLPNGLSKSTRARRTPKRTEKAKQTRTRLSCLLSARSVPLKSFILVTHVVRGLKKANIAEKYSVFRKNLVFFMKDSKWKFEFFLPKICSYHKINLRVLCSNSRSVGVNLQYLAFHLTTTFVLFFGANQKAKLIAVDGRENPR